MPHPEPEDAEVDEELAGGDTDSGEDTEAAGDEEAEGNEAEDVMEVEEMNWEYGDEYPPPGYMPSVRQWSEGYWLSLAQLTM